MQQKSKLTLIIIALLLIASSAVAQSLEGKIEELTLENGMRWYFIEKHTSATFSGVTMFKVGGVDEEIGKTGLSHLFEHMAFKGTEIIGTTDYDAEKVILDQIEVVANALTAEEHSATPDTARIRKLSKELEELRKEHKKYVVKDEFSQIYNKHGASGTNAMTSKDYTAYINSLPANRLELWCQMEAQRIYAPVFREFYSERDVVVEERRMGVETRPRGKLFEQFLASAFIAHPYRWETVGWMSDIRQVTVEDARQLYEKYYVPSNGVGVLVGDFETETAKQLVRKYFDVLPAGPNPPEVITKEPKQEGERRITVEFDSEPLMMIGYHIPTYPHRDNVIMDVISSVLTSGRTSRLHKRLVQQEEMVTRIYSYDTPGDRYDNVFVVFAEPRAPHTLEEIEAVIYEEIQRLKTEPVSQRELQKMKNQIDASMIWRASNNLWFAFGIARSALLFGDWRYYENYRDELVTVTPEDVMEAAKKYLTKSNRTVTTLKRPEVTEK